jgi:hypothetical protein
VSTPLSDEWVGALRAELAVDDRGAGSPEESTVDVCVGDRRLRFVVADGDRVVALTAYGTGDATATFTLPPALAADVLAGTTTPSALTMQGRCKTAGDHQLVLRSLAATAGPRFAEVRAALAESANP